MDTSQVESRPSEPRRRFSDSRAIYMPPLSGVKPACLCDNRLAQLVFPTDSHEMNCLNCDMWESFLWFIMKGRRIIAVHGVRNKGKMIAAGDLKTATERMEDWLKRVK